MDKELLTQLNKLKDIKPDSAWKQRNRDILLSQISAATTDEKSVFDVFMQKLSLLRYVSQPVMAVFLIVGVLLGGGLFSFRAAKNTKPGDSLYIAKIISERTQYALTFNEEGKVKLGIEFAGNRAKEITQVLSDDGAEEKVAKLKDNFKKEINEAKTRLGRINTIESSKSNNETQEDVVTEDDAAMVFTAGLGKEEKGIQIAEINSGDEVRGVDEAIEGDVVVDDEGVSEEKASGTPEVVEEELEVISNGTNPQSILEEAEELLNNNNYDETISKLEQAGEMMDQAGEGEVKGEYEEATSSGSIK